MRRFHLGRRSGERRRAPRRRSVPVRLNRKPARHPKPRAPAGRRKSPSAPRKQKMPRNQRNRRAALQRKLNENLLGNGRAVPERIPVKRNGTQPLCGVIPVKAGMPVLPASPRGGWIACFSRAMTRLCDPIGTKSTLAACRSKIAILRREGPALFDVLELVEAPAVELRRDTPCANQKSIPRENSPGAFVPTPVPPCTIA